jgi:hypothetical protein
VQFITTKCASVTARDTHHFHHIFMLTRIKENESATSYFCPFTFIQTKAEGAGYTYSTQALVSFALAGLSKT